MENDEGRFLVEVGVRDVRLPVKVPSRAHPQGLEAVAGVSISARIMREFEAAWIDRFIQLLHARNRSAGMESMREMVRECTEAFSAERVSLQIDYPVFVEKQTPVSGERCLVEYHCGYSAMYPSAQNTTKVTFRMRIPCITTYPISELGDSGGLLAQLSVVSIQAQSTTDLAPEDLVSVVDRRALAPVFSFLTVEDQKDLIQRVHARRKTSVMMVDEIKDDLSLMKSIEFYSVSCSNFGILHSYSTSIATEKNYWSPWSAVEDSEL